MEIGNDLPFRPGLAGWATNLLKASPPSPTRIRAPTMGHFNIPVASDGAADDAYFSDFSSRSASDSSATTAPLGSDEHSSDSDKSVHSGLSGSGDSTLPDPDGPGFSDHSSDWETTSCPPSSPEQSPEPDSSTIHSFCGSSTCNLCPSWSSPPSAQQLPEPAPCLHAFYDGTLWIHELTLRPSPTVSWTWNGSHPSGTVAEVKAGDVTVTSHRGNDITKTGTKEDPAVHSQYSQWFPLLSMICIICKANSIIACS